MYNCYMKGGGELERYCIQTHKPLKLERQKKQTTWGQHGIITNGSPLIKTLMEITYG